MAKAKGKCRGAKESKLNNTCPHCGTRLVVGFSEINEYLVSHVYATGTELSPRKANKHDSTIVSSRWLYLKCKKCSAKWHAVADFHSEVRKVTGEYKLETASLESLHDFVFAYTGGTPTQARERKKVFDTILELIRRDPDTYRVTQAIYRAPALSAENRVELIVKLATDRPDDIECVWKLISDHAGTLPIEIRKEIAAWYTKKIQEKIAERLKTVAY
jgi:hypothetical protein